MSKLLGDPEKAKIQGENRRRAMAEDEAEILEKSEMFQVERENLSPVRWELFNYICSRINFQQFKTEGIDKLTGQHAVEYDIWGAMKTFYSAMFPYMKRLTEDNQRMRRILATKELNESEQYEYNEICKVPGDYQESSKVLLEACNRAAANRSKNTSIYTEGRKSWKK